MSQKFVSSVGSGGQGKSKEVPECPCCHHEMGKHSYMDVGSALLESIEEAQLNEAVKNQQWTKAARFQAANAMSDIRVWRTFLCEDKAILVPLVSKLKLWDDDSYGEPVIISDPEKREALLTEIRSGK
jgi:hypothetical protein